MKPLTYHADGNPDDLRGVHAGRSVVIIGGGRSAHPHARFDGCHTIAMNHHYRGTADYRVVMDPPEFFPASMFTRDDETLLIPTKYADFTSGGGGLVRDNPATRFYFAQLRGGDPGAFFTGKRLDLGDEPTRDDPGVRSVLLPALRLAHYLGFASVYLVGVDFDQHPDPTHFPRLSRKLAALAPVLWEHGLDVFNCNPSSKLGVFERRSVDEAINTAADRTRTAGLTAA